MQSCWRIARGRRHTARQSSRRSAPSGRRAWHATQRSSNARGSPPRRWARASTASSSPSAGRPSCSPRSPAACADSYSCCRSSRSRRRRSSSCSSMSCSRSAARAMLRRLSSRSTTTHATRCLVAVRAALCVRNNKLWLMLRQDTASWCAYLDHRKHVTCSLHLHCVYTDRVKSRSDVASKGPRRRSIIALSSGLQTNGT